MRPAAEFNGDTKVLEWAKDEATVCNAYHISTQLNVHQVAENNYVRTKVYMKNTHFHL